MTNLATQWHAWIDMTGLLTITGLDDDGEPAHRPSELPEDYDATDAELASASYLDLTAWHLDRWTAPDTLPQLRSRALQALRAHRWDVVGDWEDAEDGSATWVPVRPPWLAPQPVSMNDRVFPAGGPR